MMRRMKSHDPSVTLLYKERGNHIYVEAIFNSSCVSMFNSKYPNRSSIDVYVDVENKQLGFRIMSRGACRKVHGKAVSVTKAVRELQLQGYNVRHVPIKWDAKLDMYVVTYT